MKLPTRFEERMIALLEEEFPQFFQSFEDPRFYGLRINTLKWSVEEALRHIPYHLSPVAWVKEGFYFTEEQRPAKHPYYHAGLYYIQEPSAMAPGAMMPIEPGDRVLDLCAAPGGKSTQVAARLEGKGLLVSNDISSDRIKALLKNIELAGVRNAIVTNETPDRLAKVFETFFDKILIDAPCSGEGMFRKSPEMIKSWEQHMVDRYVVMQEEILDEAAKMLRDGGYILYSTCTFAPEENEQQIARFLTRHPNFDLVMLPEVPNFGRGNKNWGKTDLPMDKTVRLWPHQLKGEGHYLALLYKKGEKERNESFSRTKPSETKVSEKELVDFRQFEREVLHSPILEMMDGELYTFKGHLYVKSKGLPALQGIKVVKSGWYLGELKKNRFEPSQAFAMGLNPKEVKETINFSSDDEEVIRYLKGETIHRDGTKGWKLVTVDGFPLGWAKQVQGFLKNAYPPGWRLLS
jgi:NOL1/NOP2/sun family putative RNA methylase